MTHESPRGTKAQVETSRRHGSVVGVDVTEEQLRMATEAGDIGLWDVDPIANTLYWPRRVRRMFGNFSEAPVTLDADFYGGVHADDRLRVAAAYAEAIDPAVRSHYDVEFRTVGKDDGIVRWVAAKGRGIFDADGRCIRVIGTAVDITARKRSEARLTELNETLEQRLAEFLAERKVLSDIVEGADTLMQAVDLDFRCLAINRACADAFEMIYGTRPRVGDSILDAIQNQPEQRELVRQRWQRAFESDGFVDVFEFGRPAGVNRNYEVHFRPLYDSRGTRLGAYQFVHDVTERRKAEVRLAQTEAALNNARRMEAVGLLTGGIAHDFNNILQALSTKFELIRRRSTDAERVAGWAADGVDAARRGARLTAQLMTFSRHQEPNIRPVDLSKLLADMGDILRTTAGPTVSLVVDYEPVWVHADSTQLEMAFLNLTVNARDAMQAGGQLRISIVPDAEAPAELATASYCAVRVRDTGSGMSADVISRAFEPFFTTKDVGLGSGLGLSQVYSMARRAGGAVSIDSDGRSYAEVSIFLRRAAPGTTAPEATAEPSVDGALDKAKAVLVIDDDHEVRSAVVHSLRDFGHEVLEAASGEEGLDVLSRNHVDLMLVDYAMPGMTGATTAQLARSRRPDLPIVFMSGYADIGAIRDALGQGATLLRKPFELRELQRVVSLEASRRK